MDVSINEKQIRDFVRFLQCASKFGDDLHIHANKQVWEMSVTNSSKSAFCLFKLDSGLFFERFKALGTQTEKTRGVKCQILVKSLLAVIGKASSTNNVTRLDMKIVNPDDNLRPVKRTRRMGETSNSTDGGARESRGTTDDAGSDEEEMMGIEAMIVLKLVCKHGVTKTHALHVGSSEFLRADVDPASTPSGFVIDARNLRDWLDHFHISLTTSSASSSGGAVTIKYENQLSWMFAPQEVRIKSWEGGSKDLSTEMRLDPKEFVDYYVYDDRRVDLTLPMREFRATLALAEQLSIRLVVAFSEPGQPLTLTNEPPGDDQPEPYDIFCAIATTTCDQFGGVKPQEVKSSRCQSAKSTTSRPKGGSAAHSVSDLTSGSRNGSAVSFSQRRTSSTPRRAGSLALSASQQARNGQQPVVYGSIATGSRVPSRDHNADNGGPSTSQRHSGNGHGIEEGEDGAGHEGLFLPGGSQEHPNDIGSDAAPRLTQGRVMSQAEVIEMSGMGNMDPAELEAELDMAEYEDELEAEEEMQEMQGQRQTGEVVGDDSSMFHRVFNAGETADGDASGADEFTSSGRRRVPLQELQVDESIFPFDRGEDTKGMEEMDGMADGGEHENLPGRSPPGAGRDDDGEVGGGSDDEPMLPTQAPKDEGFNAFFDD